MFESIEKKRKLIGRFLYGARLPFLLAIAASFGTTLLTSLTPQVFRFGIDSVIGGDERYAYLADHLWLLAMLLIGIAVLSGICQFFFRWNSSIAGECFAQNMRDTLFSHIQRLPIAWQDQNQTGDIIQRCTSDVETIRTFVVSQLLEVFRTVFLVVVYYAMMLSMNVKLSLIILTLVPVIVLYSVIFYRLIGGQFVKADEAEGELSTAVQENATGVRVIRAFGREEYEMRRFREKNDTYARLWIRLGEILGLYWGIGDLFSGLQVILVIVLGSIQAVHGEISVGQFIAFASYNTTLTWPIRSLGRILSEMSKADVSFERIDHIISSMEEDYMEGEEVELEGHEICYDHVSFSYENPSSLTDLLHEKDKIAEEEERRKEVLKDISFCVAEGRTIGILGGTGSGKSTLMQLLLHLYEAQEGSIRIGGRDIREIPLGQLRSMIGIVLQEPYLYSRSIYENIAAGKPGASLEQVRHVARIACVDQDIMAFPQGYDTIIGERGITLSGGQRQRVAIARMLLEETPIMIFDDSLSAVDSETDYKIRQALKKEMRETTVFLISHRIPSLMSTDRILVMKEGRIVERGSHQELIRQDGIYRRIYDIQMNLDDRMEMESEDSACAEDKINPDYSTEMESEDKIIRKFAGEEVKDDGRRNL